jgi:23S rRNA (guanine745-N1)-methyltransferase
MSIEWISAINRVNLGLWSITPAILNGGFLDNATIISFTYRVKNSPMFTTSTIDWICPSCGGDLRLDKGVFCCDNKHSFDMAKEGYVNLLLAQHKNSKEPGDNKQMVNARRLFLQQGHYQPLANTVAALFLEHGQQQTQDQALAFFDAGCGEGYYLDCVSQVIKSQDLEIRASGIDIAKVAVQKAAKKYPQYQFAVASTYHLPVGDLSQNGVLQIFAPSSETEVFRVLKVGAVWIRVNPGKGHLQQFKQAIYDQVTPHKTNQKIPAGFALVQQKALSFELKLSSPAERENLLMMTPYYWSATPQKKQWLLENVEQVTADFDIQILVKLAA